MLIHLETAPAPAKSNLSGWLEEKGQWLNSERTRKLVGSTEQDMRPKMAEPTMGQICQNWCVWYLAELSKRRARLSLVASELNLFVPEPDADLGSLTSSVHVQGRALTHRHFHGHLPLFCQGTGLEPRRSVAETVCLYWQLAVGFSLCAVGCLWILWSGYTH